MGAHDFRLPTPNFTPCTVEIAADQFCNRPVAVFDNQRDLLVCLEHANPGARARWTMDLRKSLADMPEVEESAEITWESLTEGWGDRHEWIAYDLAYHGHSDTTETAIVLTIGRLPAEVAAFAVERCRFLSIGRAAVGITLPGRVGTGEGDWLILLEEDVLEVDQASIITHEIAHAWLRHDRLSPDVPHDCEIQAANLTKAWGFEGIGADAEFCHAYVAQLDALNAELKAKRTN